MAEAISLVASVASLLDLALKLSNILHDLQFQVRNAPYLIQALENETQAIRTVLAHVENSIQPTATAGFGSPGSSAILGALAVELRRGAAVMKELGLFIDSLKNETSTLQRVKWVHKRERATVLIKEFKEVRSRISELQLAYGNSSLTRIELVLHDIQIMQRRQHATTDSLGACLRETRDQLIVDRNTIIQSQSNIAAALEALQTTAPTLPPDWVESISNQLATRINNFRSGPHKDDNTTASPHQTHRQQSSQAIYSALRHFTLQFKLKLVQSQCSINCACQCHSSLSSYRAWKTLPKGLQMIMGSVFFEYSCCPVSRPTCDLHICSKSRLTRLTVRYGFPFWSFKYVIHILVEKLSTSSLMFTLALRRILPLQSSGDNIIFQTMMGNLSAVKRIVSENPHAVLNVDYNGNSALHMSAMRFHPWELALQIWEVLLQAGADPDQVNEVGLSFRHTIANLVLQNRIPLKFHAQVESLVQSFQCLEELELTFVHEIVVKRCPIDIAPILEAGRAEIVAQIHSEDRFGMTPLMYAIALGDATAATALIKAGASVHRQGPFGCNLVDYVCHLPPNTCASLLDLLLTAGADAIVAFPKRWSPLHTAAIHDNVTMMERLLHEGARPDCIGPWGNRPIHYAASENSVQIVRLLYERGVNLNVLADNTISPLAVAIQHNATGAQSVLLELGADHLITGDWGTHFHLAAYWGCEETFRTLSNFKLRRLDVDARNAKGLTATSVFEQRYDKTDELTTAFYQLKDSIKSQSSEYCQVEDEVEDTDEFFDADEFLRVDGLS